MKLPASKLPLFVSAFALCTLFAAPFTQAADEKADPAAAKKAEAKARQDAEILRKYDKNGNGVLDPEEAAARQANVDKMKALRDAKKRKAEERANAKEGAKPSP